MRRFKYVFHAIENWNSGAVEQWLEEEAARGWRLTDCGNWLVKFQRHEPAVCRARVQPQEPESREAWRERIAAYEELGWVYAAARHCNFCDYEVFYCDDPAAPELQTDPVAQKWAWEKCLKRNWRNGWISLSAFLAALIWLAWMLLRLETPVEKFLDGGLELLLLLLIVPFIVLDLVGQLRRTRRTSRLLDAGLTPSHTGDLRRERRLLRVTILLWIALWGIHFVGIFLPARTFMALDDPSLPRVAAEVLDPAKDPACREYGDACKEVRLLEPERYEIVERYPDQERVATRYDRLLLSALAEPLYRERIETFRGAWPEGRQTPIRDSRFDKAVLLDNGSDGTVQMLLVRQGNVVFSVWVNFPADLSGHLDDIAAALNHS